MRVRGAIREHQAAISGPKVESAFTASNGGAPRNRREFGVALKIECTGISPILMRADRASDPLSKEARWLSEVSAKRRKTEAEIVELARREFHCNLYLDPTGRPTIPIENVHSCLYASAKRRREGPLFAGSLAVTSARFEYDGPDEPDALWKEQEKFVDRRSVKVGTSRVFRTRPIFPAWSLTVTAEHDPEVADLFHIRQWAVIAGARIGLGDYRPQRGGLFGRFEATVIDGGADNA